MTEASIYFRVSAKALVVRNGKLLLVKEENGK